MTTLAETRNGSVQLKHNSLAPWDNSLNGAPGSEEIARRAGVPPSTGIMKALLRAPILVWRLGLGRLAGRSLMLLTTTGRKSGLPRRTPVGFDEYAGRKYVVTLRGTNTDWYRNILANPRVTIQTARGAEPVRARRVTGKREIGEAYAVLSRLPIMQNWARMRGVPLSREEVVAHKDSFLLLTFDPTTEPTPPPQQPDLWWVWPAAEAAAWAVWLLVRRAHKRAFRRKLTQQPI